MADTKEINVYETTKSISFQVDTNTNVVNINKVTIEGGGGTGATNLGYTPSATNGIVTSDTGADATIPLADSTNAGLLTPAEKTKLQGIATGATANDTDANLKNRANHTGTQLTSTISDFNSSVQTIADAKVSNVPYDFNSWNGVTNVAPSKDAVRDKLDQMDVTIGNKQPQATYDTSQPTIALLDENGFLLSADTTVFANLTELGYLKGVASSIQSQIDSKQPSSVILTNTTASFTTADETKLDGIAAGAEVNVNADWNATSGDAQILNKPTIPSAVTQTSQLTNNGADGVNPFITALDIPVGSQASTLVREVKNMTGATLTKGTIVYISGANGNKPLVSKAKADTDATSARTFGLLQSDILNNGLGNCVIIGDLSGIDTSSFADGTQLYLSGTTAGTYTSTKPVAPIHLVYVGKVTRSHPTLGQIEVGIMNGFELDEIHDVLITTPTNNQALIYETATDLWKNKTILINDQVLGNETNTYNSELLSILFEDINIGLQNNSMDISQLLVLDSYSFLANNTNSSQLATAKVYKEVGEQSLSGTGISATGGSLPTGTQTHSYRWSQIGNLVTVRINLQFATAGTCSGIAIPFANMSDIPQVPQHPSIYNTALDMITYGSGNLSSNKLIGTFSVGNGASGIRIKTLATPNTYEFVVGRASNAYNNGWIHIQYFI
jgi:hypothetical protein